MGDEDASRFRPYCRQMKANLRGGELLQSHNPEAAAQEVAALVVATVPPVRC